MLVFPTGDGHIYSLKRRLSGVEEIRIMLEVSSPSEKPFPFIVDDNFAIVGSFFSLFFFSVLLLSYNYYLL